MDYKGTYNLHDILRAIKEAEVYYTKASQLGDFTAIDMVVDAELALKKAKLTPSQEEIVQLYYVEDKTVTEIGEILGISHQAVVDRLQRSRQKVQKVLDKWGCTNGVL